MRSSFALLVGLCASVAVAAACNDSGFVTGKGGDTPTPGTSPSSTSTVTPVPSGSATPTASPSPTGGGGQLIVQA
ncbi:MAG TPA: hypothetical protein VMV18_10210, partial [bacterium]|nr:hypothetical protein [bacterium]